MKIYHGGYMTVKTPEISKSKFPKDFGDGFYCTELETQAVRWASCADFIDGIITREQFWVLAKFKHPRQVCFCTEKAQRTLQFINSKEIKL